MAENSTTVVCKWCSTPFSRRSSGGKAQRFCCEAHRTAFWGSLRAWGSRAIGAGTLTVTDIMNGAPAAHATTCMLAAEGISPAAEVTPADEAGALLAALLAVP